MNNLKKPINNILEHLQERTKELNCLYKIEELLSTTDTSIENIFNGIIEAIISGWQYPGVCQVRIVYEEATFQSSSYKKTKWRQKADIVVQDKTVGKINVCYTEKMPPAEEGPFLNEERRLLDTIATRIGNFITYQKLKHSHQKWETGTQKLSQQDKNKWKIILEILNNTDKNLYQKISRKMLNFLCWNGINEAERLLKQFGLSYKIDDEESYTDPNKPLQKEMLPNFSKISEATFSIAAKHLSEKEILTCIQNWIKDDKSSVLVTVLESFDTSIGEISDALERFYLTNPEGLELNPATEIGIKVSLIYRFFTEQLQFINVAKNYVEIKYFFNLLQRIVYTHKSYGKLGGKSAGLFLAAQIIKKSSADSDLLKNIKFPKTWYVTSDILLKFIRFNNLEDLFNQKYKDIDQVRQEYPHIVQMFKNSYFPPDIIKFLSTALDDLGGYPLIVRSSSLLEDRMGSAFAGKYKSLFLANQGTKKERLDSLIDAIAEVYASTFGPDPIQYRAVRGLLDFHEEMGIMIQEVVGANVGNYFIPAYAGVIFSNNEFRWSERIKREDGLIRIVPGLGTRAVDRVSDDFPILINPSQPNLRVSVSLEEIIRYSPKKIDVINLETNTFETKLIIDLFKEFGDKYPKLNQIISILEHDHIKQSSAFDIDFDKDNIVVTFDGLIKNTTFVAQVKTLLELLRKNFNTPVDLEFASDGENFYLLQCRPQCYSEESLPVPIPKDIPKDEILFSANRFISNGKVSDISHIIYVDPEQYNRIENLSDLKQVGKAVSKLNKLLPRRKFILMGPGRWGSRGDIKLGVNVTYSDINNTAVLIEIARKKGNYLPDLSFGTHFFQDLVESFIRYIPLYPDEPDIIFNETFLMNSYNSLPDLVPEYSHLSNAIRVIDIPKITGGSVLQILMNAEVDEAVGILIKSD
jgi:pyruvate, water dikinase